VRISLSHLGLHAAFVPAPHLPPLLRALANVKIEVVRRTAPSALPPPILRASYTQTAPRYGSPRPSLHFFSLPSGPSSRPLFSPHLLGSGVDFGYDSCGHRLRPQWNPLFCNLSRVTDTNTVLFRFGWALNVFFKFFFTPLTFGFVGLLLLQPLL